MDRKSIRERKRKSTASKSGMRECDSTKLDSLNVKLPKERVNRATPQVNSSWRDFFDSGVSFVSSGKEKKPIDFVSIIRVPKTWQKEMSSSNRNDAEMEWIIEFVLEKVNELYLLFCNLTYDNPDWAEAEQHANHLVNGVMFRWHDKGEKKPKLVTPGTYVEKLYLWVEEILGSEEYFPSDATKSFPECARKKLEKVYQRLVRIYTIIMFSPSLLDRMDDELKTCFANSLKIFLYYGWFWELLNENSTKGLIDQTVLKKIEDDFSKDADKLYVD